MPLLVSKPGQYLLESTPDPMKVKLNEVCVIPVQILVTFLNSKSKL